MLLIELTDRSRVSQVIRGHLVVDDLADEHEYVVGLAVVLDRSVN